MPAKNTVCLWYDGDAEEAARFYAETFDDGNPPLIRYHRVVVSVTLFGWMG